MYLYLGFVTETNNNDNDNHVFSNIYQIYLWANVKVKGLFWNKWNRGGGIFLKSNKRE